MSWTKTSPVRSIGRLFEKKAFFEYMSRVNTVWNLPFSKGIILLYYRFELLGNSERVNKWSAMNKQNYLVQCKEVESEFYLRKTFRRPLYFLWLTIYEIAQTIHVSTKGNNYLILWNDRRDGPCFYFIIKIQ